MLFKIIGTALTGIGGHYLNRRWDKAVLFLTLFILYCIFCWMVLRTYLFSNIQTASMPGEDMVRHFREVAATAAMIYLAGIIILWIISIVVTITDGMRERRPEGFRWTKTGVTAACLTTLLSVVLIAYTAVASVSTIRAKDAPIESPIIEETESHIPDNFYEYIYFGKSPSNSERLPAPPEGPGVLRGRMIFMDRPAEAVTMKIVLNSKYIAKDVVTDSDGVFKVPLPPGDWKINSIQTEGWSNKPDNGQFTLYYGGEDKLRGNRFDRHIRFRQDGYKATVGEDGDNVHINITIKKDIELVWPDANTEGVDAGIGDAIRWAPYPSAVKYLVEIQGLKREGSTTYFNPITTKVIESETTLPLSSLKHIKTSAKEKQEYSVGIYAFSEDGTLLGQSIDRFRGGTFKLADGHVLVEDKLQGIFAGLSDDAPDDLEEKMEQIALDRRRVDAVEVLIEDQLLSEAGRLLDMVSSEHATGRKEVLSGYILALEGKCIESNKMFETALAVNPEVCIPDKYRAICPQ